MPATTIRQALKSALAPSSRFTDPMVAFKASVADDGIIIGKLCVADVRDRENERVTVDALKAAAHELAMKSSGGVDYDANHDLGLDCDLVGVWFGAPMPDENALYVAVRPHDPAVYEAAKSGEIIGFSWSGPYKLSEDT
jgi:hypothetical protein